MEKFRNFKLSLKLKLLSSKNQLNSCKTLQFNYMINMKQALSSRIEMDPEFPEN